MTIIQQFPFYHERLPWNFCTWPAVGIELQTFWSWDQGPIHSPLAAAVPKYSYTKSGHEFVNEKWLQQHFQVWNPYIRHAATASVTYVKSDESLHGLMRIATWVTSHITNTAWDTRGYTGTKMLRSWFYRKCCHCLSRTHGFLALNPYKLWCRKQWAYQLRVTYYKADDNSNNNNEEGTLIHQMSNIVYQNFSRPSLQCSQL